MGFGPSLLAGKDAVIAGTLERCTVLPPELFFASCQGKEKRNQDESLALSCAGGGAAGDGNGQDLCLAVTAWWPSLNSAAKAVPSSCPAGLPSLVLVPLGSCVVSGPRYQPIPAGKASGVPAGSCIHLCPWRMQEGWGARTEEQ